METNKMCLRVLRKRKCSLSSILCTTLAVNLIFESVDAAFLSSQELETSPSSPSAENLEFRNVPNRSVNPPFQLNSLPDGENKVDKVQSRPLDASVEEEINLDEHPPFNGNVTPFFIIDATVCNAPGAIAFHLYAHGQNVSFFIIEEDAKSWIEIDSQHRVVLKDKLEDFGKSETDLKVTILVNSRPPPDLEEADVFVQSTTSDPLTLLFPGSSLTSFYAPSTSSSSHPVIASYPASFQNQLRLQLRISNSYCPGLESRTTTIVIVSLSVLSLVLLALLSLTLIILRRRKPYIFTRHPSQVSPTISDQDVYSNGSTRNWSSHPNGIMSKSNPKLDPILKPPPSKSSLKSAKSSLAQVPELSVTTDSPPSTASSSRPYPDKIDPDLGAAGDLSDASDSSRVGHAGDLAHINGDSKNDSPRKRSVVTFNETTQIIQIGKK